jgi:hypothetical protein
MTFFLMHHRMKKLPTCFKRKFCNCTAEERGEKKKNEEEEAHPVPRKDGKRQQFFRRRRRRRMRMQGAQVPIQIWIWPVRRFSDSIVTCPQQLHREKTSRGASSYQKREVVRISAGSVCNRHYSYVISLSLSQSLSERVAFPSTSLFVKRAQFLRSKTIMRLKGNRCGRQASKLQITKLQAMSHLHKQVPACCISRTLSLSELIR